MHGALKPWAVPKGVPYGLDERGLAMATEDHPIEYLAFEGTIPEGQYGGGTVMVWDIGTLELVEGNYYKGNLQLYLKGKKLKGEWHLTKDRGSTNKNWLLVSSGESMKRPSAGKENASALTGRTLKQIAADNDAQWHSNRAPIPGVDLDSLPRSDMKFVEPMLAKSAGELPEGADWHYEIKLDGYRALAIKDRGTVRLLSRRNNPLNENFPEVARAVQNLEDGVIVDGKIVALDAEGRPSFNLLQHRKENSQAIVFYLFDLLTYRGRDLRGLPLRQRRELLNRVLQSASEPIRLSAILDAAPIELIEAVRFTRIGRDRCQATRRPLRIGRAEWKLGEISSEPGAGARHWRIPARQSLL